VCSTPILINQDCLHGFSFLRGADCASPHLQPVLNTSLSTTGPFWTAPPPLSRTHNALYLGVNFFPPMDVCPLLKCQHFSRWLKGSSPHSHLRRCAPSTCRPILLAPPRHGLSPDFFRRRGDGELDSPRRWRSPSLSAPCPRSDVKLSWTTTRQPPRLY